MSDDIDIHAVLAKGHQIAIVWSVQDVQQLHPDLSDEQAWQVLRDIEHNHDCNQGVTWDLIDWVASQMFSSPSMDATKSVDEEGDSLIACHSSEGKP
jgi:hypothetical protein